MEELRKYQLGTSEWDALAAFQKILAVSTISCYHFMLSLTYVTGTSRLSAEALC